MLALQSAAITAKEKEKLNVFQLSITVIFKQLAFIFGNMRLMKTYGEDILSQRQ